MTAPTTDPTDDRNNLPKVIGGRATPEQVRIIDLAATLAGVTRAEFLVEHAYRAAVNVIGHAAPQLLAQRTTPVAD